MGLSLWTSLSLLVSPFALPLTMLACFLTRHLGLQRYLKEKARVLMLGRSVPERCRMGHDCLFSGFHSWAPPGKFLAHVACLPRPPERAWDRGCMEEGTCEMGAIRGRLARGGKAHVQQSFQSPIRKGLRRLSEIRVQDMGHFQCWASFLSQRNCKVLSMEKNH